MQFIIEHENYMSEQYVENLRVKRRNREDSAHVIRDNYGK